MVIFPNEAILLPQLKGVIFAKETDPPDLIPCSLSSIF